MSIGKISAYFSHPRNLALFVIAMSAFALGFAYTAQYAFHILPCHLCYEQRKPYIINIALGLLALAGLKAAPRATIALLVLAGVAFTANIGLAAFHVGVEYGWWEGLTTCGGDGAIADFSKMTVEEMNSYFANQPIVRCDVAGWRLFGISMTGYNFMYAVFCSAFIFFHLAKGRKKA
ncbi:MAG: disulfide bond formation protein B [Micavibrio sp.]|nr:disulfide bond formation protein B [Micavibrio sp.]